MYSFPTVIHGTWRRGRSNLRVAVAILAAALLMAAPCAAQDSAPDFGDLTQACTTTNGLPNTNAPVPGAEQLTPGRYWDVDRGGHGWDFFWYTPNGATSSNPSDQRLFVVFYTHRREGDSWKPVWYGAVGTGQDAGFRFDPANPSRRLGWDGELRRYRQIPRDSDQFVELAGVGDSGVVSEPVGTIRLAFTDANAVPDAESIGVHWQLSADDGNAAYVVDRSCLRRFGDPDANPPGTGALDALSGAWAERSQTFWLLMAYFHGTYEQQLLLYFEGSADAATPRWVHAPLITGSLAPTHACAASGASSAPPGTTWQGTWRHRCLLRVNGYAPDGTATAAGWQADLATAQTRVGWLSHTLTQSGQSTAKVQVTPLDPIQPLFATRPVDGDSPLKLPTDIVHRNGASEIRVSVWGQGTADTGAGSALDCYAQTLTAMCRLQLHWLTEGAYPGATLFKVQGSPPEYTVVATSRPRTASLGMTVDQGLSGDRFHYELWSDRSRRELLAVSRQVNAAFSSVCTPSESLALAVSEPLNNAVVDLAAPRFTFTTANAGQMTRYRAKFLAESAPGVWEVVQDHIGTHTSSGSPYTVPVALDAFGDLSRRFRWIVQLYSDCAASQVVGTDFRFSAPEVPDDPSYRPDDPAQSDGWKPDPQYASDNGNGVAASNAAVGLIEATDGVQGGAATVTIPIVVPPGRRGIQPELALSYSSRNGNGIAGMGFSLAGLSSIHRCPAIIDIEGIAGVVNFGADDRLCLDGQRLVAAAGSGSYGTANAEYRTEVDSYARITQLGGAISGSTAPTSYFKVETRDGEIHYYGAGPGGVAPLGRATPSGAPAPLSWLLVRREDRSGNALEVEYTDYDDAEVLPTALHYTGKASGGTLTRGNRRVNLTYADRPTSAPANDYGSSYLSRGLTRQRKRLVSIATFAPGYAGAVRTYSLAYEQSAYTGRSLLKSVVVCAAADSCRPARTFTWSQEPPPARFQLPRELTELSLLTGLSGNEDTEPSLITPDGDYDGDGSRELRVKLSNGNRYLVSTTASRTIRGYIPLGSEGSDVGLLGGYARTVDFNGDGRSDVFGVENGRPRVGYWRPGSTQWSQASFDIVEATDTVLPAQAIVVDLVDMNGDGRTDLVVDQPYTAAAPVGPAIETCSQARHAVVYFATGKPGAGMFLPPRHLLCLDDVANPRRRESISRISDFDGNGLPDLFVSLQSSEESVDTKSLALVSRVANGDLALQRLDLDQLFAGGSSDPHRQTDASDRRFRFWTDVNGDGLDDWLFPSTCSGLGYSTWTVRLNQGGRLGSRRCTTSRRGLEFFSDPNTPRYAHGMRTIDIDADGRQELLLPKAVSIAICTYQITSSPSCNGSPSAGAGSPGAPDSINDVCSEGYYCPSNPITGQSTFSLVSSGGAIFRDFYGPGSPIRALRDDSIYEMSALQFVDTGTGAAEPEYVAREVDTGIRSRLGASHVEDAYGDGLQDVITRVGCGWQDQDGAGYDRCIVLPAASPDLQKLPAGFDPAAGYRMFVVENPGVRIDGAPRVESPMPPDLLIATRNALPPGVALNSESRWSHHQLAVDNEDLSVVQAGRNLPLYSIPARDSPASQADSSHFYFASSMPVVSEYRTTAGSDAGTLLRRRFSYSEALYNHAGRGVRGFARIVEDSMDDGLRTVTDFRQKFPYTSAVECQSVVLTTDTGLPSCGSASPRPLRQTLTEWSAVASSACAGTPMSRCWHLRSPAEEATANDLSDRATVSVERVARSFDEFGNVTTAASSTEDYVPAAAPGASTLASTRTTSVSSTFLPRTTGGEWWPSLLTRAVTTTTVSYGAGHVAAIALQPTSRTTSRIPVYSEATCARQLPAAVFDVDGAGSALARNAGAATICGDLGTTLDNPPVDAYHLQALTYDAYGNVLTVEERATGTGTSLSERRKAVFTFGADADASAGYFQRTESRHVLGSTGTTLVQHPIGQVVDPRFGTIESTTDLNGLVTRAEVDPWGLEKRRVFPSAGDLQSAPSLVTTRQWCTSAGRCGSAVGGVAAWREITQQQGAPVTRAFSDVRGRVVRWETQAFTDGRWSVVQHRYDPRGFLTRETPIFDDAGSQALADGGSHTSYSGHDPLGRPAQRDVLKTDLAVDAAAGAATTLRTRYQYSGATATLTLQRVGGSSAGEVGSVTVERTHDRAGRVLRTVDAQGGVTGFWYDGAGNPVLITDALGRHTQASYDNLGRRTQTIDPNRGTWTFRYDGYGQLIEQRDARYESGLYALTQRFDSLGRLVSRDWRERKQATGTAALCGHDEWNYDVSGIGLLASSKRYLRNLDGSTCETTDLERVEETAGYDALYRPLQRIDAIYRHARGLSESLTTRYAYDRNFGRPKGQVLPGLVATYTAYGPRGHVVEEGDATGFVAYGSAQNRYYRKVTAINAAGAVTRSLVGNRPLGGNAYGPAMQRDETLDEGSGRLRAICVRLAGDLGACTAGNASLAASGRIVDLAYGYDVYDNLTRTQDTGIHLDPAGRTVNTGLRESYAYDTLFRIETATRSGDSIGDVTRYTYDALGNLQSKSDFSTDTPGAYAYATPGKPYAVSRVARPGSGNDVAYAYDANGNLGQRQNYPRGYTTTVHHDIDNRPRALAWSDTVQGATFSYRPDGSRYLQVQRQTANSVPTELLYAGPGFEREIGSSGVTERYYLPGGALLVQRNGTRTLSYLHGDRLGSIGVITDADGRVLEQRGFDPYGKPRDGDDWGATAANALNPPPATTAPANRRGFTTHEHLEAFRLIHMNGRLFDFHLGRFHGVDPVIQFPTNSQSLNPYSYILNNPLAGTDPTGYVACGDVSLDKPGSGTCDFMQGGKTTEVGYSVGSNGNVAIGGSRNLAALSGVVSTGVLRSSNGSDSMSSVGSSSAARSSASNPASIGASGTSVRSQAASILTPNIASLGNRGGVGSWAQRAAGFGKAALNAFGEIMDIAANRDYGGPVLEIGDDELEGAAAFDVAGFVSAPIRSAARGGLATAGGGDLPPFLGPSATW